MKMKITIKDKKSHRVFKAVMPEGVTRLLNGEVKPVEAGHYVTNGHWLFAMHELNPKSIDRVIALTAMPANGDTLEWDRQDGGASKARSPLPIDRVIRDASKRIYRTDLSVRVGKSFFDIWASLDNSLVLSINNLYSGFVEEHEFVLWASDELSAIACTDKNGESIVGVVMPCSIDPRTCKLLNEGFGKVGA